MHKNQSSDACYGARLKIVRCTAFYSTGVRPAAREGNDLLVNPLQQLIQDWLDADPTHSVGVLARRGDFPSRNTIYAILNRDAPATVPRDETLKRLARGLGVPLHTVRTAAADAAGYRVESVDLSPDMQTWVALLDELPEERRADLLEIGRVYLRLAQEAP